MLYLSQLKEPKAVSYMGSVFFCVDNELYCWYLSDLCDTFSCLHNIFISLLMGCYCSAVVTDCFPKDFPVITYFNLYTTSQYNCWLVSSPDLYILQSAKQQKPLNDIPKQKARLWVVFFVCKNYFFMRWCAWQYFNDISYKPFNGLCYRADTKVPIKR